MPFESVAQEAWGHSPEGIKALGGKAAVAEWDKETEGKKLPARKRPESQHQSRKEHPSRMRHTA